MSLLKHCPNNHAEAKKPFEIDLDPLMDMDDSNQVFEERLELFLGVLRTGLVTDPEYIKKLIFNLAKEHKKVLMEETIKIIEKAEKINHEFMTNMMLDKIWGQLGIFLTALEIQKTIERLIYHFERSGKTWEDYKTTRIFVRKRTEVLLSEIEQHIIKVEYKGAELKRVQKELGDLKDYLSSMVKVF